MLELNYFYVFTTAESRVKTCPVALVAVRCKVVVLLLFMQLVIAAPIVCGVFVLDPCFVMQYLFAIILLGKER